MTDPTAAKETEFKIDFAEINALLQARGTGQVGAILADSGTPTKNGSKTLFMLRGLAARGFLAERPVEDENQKTIIYFDLARRADLYFLDQCASAAIVDLANKNRELDELTKTMSENSAKAANALSEVNALINKLESEFALILAWATEIQGLAGQFADGEPGAPDACSAIEAKAKAVTEKLAKMMEK